MPDVVKNPVSDVFERWKATIGDECATTPSFQSESYATGSKASSKAYEIDDASHKAMVGMGFRRIYGPVRQNNADNSIKRVVSRYSRIYTGTLL